ncbi:hypothetical protein [Dysgonomonas massiliensis]|uniref:hypothetical protein n=1 Tax=Dysgonomonas massiliensis TaxID=2040292 RepID=UPI000C78294A|nr:hypothetical protein [Dysgonomonas massiliensis]
MLNKGKTDYITLFDIINNNKEITPEQLQSLFNNKLPKTNFAQTASYLYKVLLDNLLSLKAKNDIGIELNNEIGKAQILFDKSMYEEALNKLSQVKAKASKHENVFAFLSAARLELKYLHALNFPDISEKELLNRHLQINESLKIIRRINEQSVLHELMTHRMLYRENVRSYEDKEALNDLNISEMSIMAASNIENFEIKKLHQLFQSSYLIHIGDYKSALRSYYELNDLFEKNSSFWANPPIYYTSVLEGILRSLRNIKEYNSMGYFIDKIRMLKKYPFKDYQLYLSYLIAIYELFPLIDCGRFKEASIQIENNWGEVLDKEHTLPSHNRAIISLYIALTCFGLGKYREALQRLNRLLFLSKKITFIPLYRTIRLVKLMILFELDELEDYDFEVRSFRRGISKISKAYKVEHIMLNFLSSGKSLILNKEKEWPKIQMQLSEISNDVYEKQILRLFDFTAWIEAKMTNTDLSYVIQVHRKSEHKSY